MPNSHTIKVEIVESLSGNDRVALVQRDNLAIEVYKDDLEGLIDDLCQAQWYLEQEDDKQAAIVQENLAKLPRPAMLEDDDDDRDYMIDPWDNGYFGGVERLREID